MKRFFLLFVIVILAVSCSKKVVVPEVSEERTLVRNFFVLRQMGNSDSAWLLLSEKTRKQFTAKEFKNYCFVYRVKDFNIAEKKDGFYKVDYTFYDKRINKKGELHNYFIRNLDEYITVDNGGILFPHPGFLAMREAISAKDTERVQQVIKQMLKLSPRQPEVLETAKTMGLM